MLAAVAKRCAGECPTSFPTVAQASIQGWGCYACTNNVLLVSNLIQSALVLTGLANCYLGAFLNYSGWGVAKLFFESIRKMRKVLETDLQVQFCRLSAFLRQLVVG
jgi:hypothetical protein